MKAIRYIASVLLIGAGVCHIYLFLQEPAPIGGSAIVLTFGIIYFVIGILLFLKIKYSPILGIVFPLLGVIVGSIVFDPTQGPLLMKILGIVDLVNIILCSVLVWRRKKTV
jgi:hypothetical protein